MIELEDGSELNIGPLPKRAKDASVRVYKVDGTWGLCLSEEYLTDEYVEEMRDLVGPDVDDVLSHLDESGFDVEWLWARICGEDAAEFDSEWSVGSSIRLKDLRASEFHSASKDEQFLAMPRIPGTVVPEDGVPARIIKLTESGFVSRVDLHSAPEVVPNLGEDIIVTVSEKSSTGVSGAAGAIPVFTPEVPEVVPDRIGMTVKDRFDDHVRGSVGDFVAKCNFKEGDVVQFEITGVDNQGLVGVADGVPVRVADGIGKVGDRFRAGVAKIEGQHIEARVSAIPEDDRPSEGDVVRVSPIHPTADQKISTSADRTIASIDEIPVVIPSEIPPIVDEIVVGITEVEGGHLTASLQARPSSDRLSVGEEITVQVSTASNGDGFATPKETPLRIIGAGEFVGTEIHVKVTKVGPGCATARVDETERAKSLRKESELTIPRRAQSVEGDFAILEGIPIQFADSEPFPQEDVKASIDRLTASHISVSIASLGESDRPKRGDKLILSADKEATTEIVRNGIPFRLSSNSTFPAADLWYEVIEVEPSHALVEFTGLCTEDDSSPKRTIELSPSEINDDGRHRRGDVPLQVSGETAWYLSEDIDEPIRFEVDKLQDGCVEISAVVAQSSREDSVGEPVPATVAAQLSSKNGVISDGLPFLLPRSDIPVGKQVMIVPVMRKSGSTIAVPLAIIDEQASRDGGSMPNHPSIPDLINYYRQIGSGIRELTNANRNDAITHFKNASQIFDANSTGSAIFRLEAERQIVFAKAARSETCAYDVSTLQTNFTHRLEEFEEIQTDAVEHELSALRFASIAADESGEICNIYMRYALNSLRESNKSTIGPWNDATPHFTLMSIMHSLAKGRSSDEARSVKEFFQELSTPSPVINPRMAFGALPKVRPDDTY